MVLKLKIGDFSTGATTPKHSEKKNKIKLQNIISLTELYLRVKPKLKPAWFHWHARIINPCVNPMIC